MTTTPVEKNSTTAATSPGDRMGLCARCLHRLATGGRKGVFVRCGLSKTDEGFPRYPLLPVISCRGFVEPTDSR